MIHTVRYVDEKNRLISKKFNLRQITDFIKSGNYPIILNWYLLEDSNHIEDESDEKNLIILKEFYIDLSNTHYSELKDKWEVQLLSNYRLLHVVIEDGHMRYDNYIYNKVFDLNNIEDIYNEQIEIFGYVMEVE